MATEMLMEEESELMVMDATGDTRMQWNRNNAAEVQAARDRFHELRGRGYMAYSVNRKGDRGEVLEEFDPAAERIIMHTQMVGG